MGASYSQSALAYIKALLLQSIKTHDSVLNCLAQEASVPHCEYIERNIENVFTHMYSFVISYLKVIKFAADREVSVPDNP